MKKILIANRGECALRIHQTLEKKGFQSIMVYSDADRGSPHLQLGSQAYCLGDGLSSRSYLDQDKVLEVAKRSGAIAIHPGYGFLSENAEFAKKCMDHGLIWIGPHPDLITLFGDKLAARKAITEQGISVLPGTLDPVIDIEHAREVAQGLGFPVLVKAAGGGGGKGMRVVRTPEELESALKSAGSEAGKAFSDSRVFIEKFLDKSFHIEFQVLGDQHDWACHFGYRECSIQRRHQKILEESPSVNVREEEVRGLLKLLVGVTRRLGYDSLGTFEFMRTQEGDYYFLEMNTRLQVEHSVTEMTYGVDLVDLQIRAAMGESLEAVVGEPVKRGWAIEARIYAEDPLNDFSPEPGKVSLLSIPKDEQVRLDTYLGQGIEVPVYYDPMVAKVTAYGESRESVILRLSRYLKAFRVKGFSTNIPFHIWVLDHADFLGGMMHTNYVSGHKDEMVKGLSRLRDQVYAVGSALGFFLTGPDPAYRSYGLRLALNQELHHFSLDYSDYLEGVGCKVILDGEEGFVVDLLRVGDSEFCALLNHLPFSGQFKTEDSRLIVGIWGMEIEIQVFSPGTLPLNFLGAAAMDSDGSLSSPINGKIVQVLSSAGQRVQEGDLLLILEAMKMENEIRAPIAGVLKSIQTEIGLTVKKGDILAEVQEEEDSI
jgi:acetyl/propionyl-CoA carboxylase alpha subunit